MRFSLAVPNQTRQISCHQKRTQSLQTNHGSWLQSQLAKRYGRQEAEDLAQDTWLRLASITASFIPEHPRAFLLRVANNLAINRHHRRGVGERVEATAAPDDRLDADQEMRVLYSQIILGLPEPLRDVFLLSRVDGLTNVQIGEKLGISPKTVEWRMTRALAQCAAQLRR